MYENLTYNIRTVKRWDLDGGSPYAIIVSVPSEELFTTYIEEVAGQVQHVLETRPHALKGQVLGGSVACFEFDDPEIVALVKLYLLGRFPELIALPQIERSYEDF